MGIDQALSEEIILNQGSMKNSSLTDYLMPTAKDVSEIQTFWVDSEEPTGPFGAEEMGESVNIAPRPPLF
jgi:CO/xanthine dehydrogenase Mo-binding subunit